MTTVPLLILSACLSGTPAAAPIADAHAACRLLGRGVNLGNALEAPREGAWGMRLEAEFFPAIKQAGFDSVRIPIRWQAHAAEEAPYAIDPEFLARIDWAVDQALKNDLVAAINFHHYEELYENPSSEADRFLALWTQVAEHFKDRPDRVFFEVLNEPHGNLKDAAWTALVPRALAAIRASNPERFVVVGPTEWNGFRKLPALELPEADRRLIATFHYYEPFEFTHQGASWAGPDASKWLGRTWTGTTEQAKKLNDDFDAVARWAEEHDRPIYLGEFGAFERAPMPSRAAWTAAVARAAEARGFAWAYWEFGAGFGAYDRRAKTWREPLVHALVPSPGR